MRRTIVALLTLFGLSSLAVSQENNMENPTRVKLSTSLGDIVIELETAKAPVTSQNFIDYVTSGFYDGTIFHRVIPNFMAQGGGFTADFQQKSTREPIRNEADNGLKNERGTVAMARTSDPHSATSQFFINYKDNAFLDYRASNPQGWGYAVFGRVVEGMDVADRMATLPTASKGGHEDVPATPIVIEKTAILPD